MIEEIKKLLQIEYEAKKLQIEREAQERKNKVYRDNPELQELEKNTRIKTNEVINALLNAGLSKEELSRALDRIAQEEEKEKESILNKLGISENYFLPKYECEKCNDTSFVDGKRCVCFKKRLAEEIFKEQDLLNPNLPSLEEIEINFYKDEEQKKKMANIIASLQKFTDNFEAYQGVSHIFYGPPGVGKTFLSNALAKSLSNRGYFVIYQTSPDLFTGNFDSTPVKDKLLIESDFLIIDDMGKEHLSAITKRDIFNIINKRFEKKKSFLISTNENPKNIMKLYGEAIFSRLSSSSNLYEFIGPSLR